MSDTIPEEIPPYSTPDEIMENFCLLIESLLDEDLENDIAKRMVPNMLGTMDYMYSAMYWQIEADFDFDFRAACLAYSHLLRAHSDVITGDVPLAAIMMGALVSYCGFKGLTPPLTKEEAWAEQRRILEEKMAENPLLNMLRSLQENAPDGVQVISLSDLGGIDALGELLGFGPEDDDANVVLPGDAEEGDE